MSNYFDIVAAKLADLGVFQYLLPFILICAITYALFRKSKVLGDSALINGLVAGSLAFMVIFGFPIATGFNIAAPLSIFFMQVSIFMIIFVIAGMIASVFYPNMQEWLPTVFKSRSWLMILIGLGVGLFVTSGLVGVFTSGFFGGGAPAPGAPPGTPRDVIVISAGIVIFILLLAIAASIGAGRISRSNE